MQAWFCPPSRRGLPNTNKPAKQRSVLPAPSKGAENKKRPSLGAFRLKIKQKLHKTLVKRDRALPFRQCPVL